MKSIEFDNQLIFQLLNGDRSAFDKIYAKYAKHYFLICQRYARSQKDAEDYLQEALISIYQNAKSFDASRANFKTWSSKVVVNTCLQSLRKNNILVTIDQFIDSSVSYINENEASSNYSLEQITRVIQKLPKGYRTVFNLYVVEGYTHSEISDILNISEGTSKSQLMRARKLLQEKLNPVKKNKLVAQFGKF